MKKIALAILLTTPALALANPGYYIQSEVGPSLSSIITGGGAGLNGGYLWGDNSLNYGIEAGMAGNAGMEFFCNASSINLSLLGVLKYYFQSGFVTFAKAGLSYTDQTISDDFGYGSISVNGVGPEAALGIGYQFNPNWEMDLTAEAATYKPFGAQDNSGSNGDNSYMYSGGLFLGLTYHFA